MVIKASLGCWECNVIPFLEIFNIVPVLSVPNGLRPSGPNDYSHLPLTQERVDLEQLVSMVR